MLEEAVILSRLPLSNIKFHQLQIIRNTRMADEYRNHPEHFRLFGPEEYVEFVCDFLERLLWWSGSPARLPPVTLPVRDGASGTTPW